jgi:hypothetical protein
VELRLAERSLTTIGDSESLEFEEQGNRRILKIELKFVGTAADGSHEKGIFAGNRREG